MIQMILVALICTNDDLIEPLAPTALKLERIDERTSAITFAETRLELEYHDPFETHLKLYRDGAVLFEVHPVHGISDETIIDTYVTDLDRDGTNDIVISSYVLGATGISANIAVFHVILMRPEPTYLHASTFFGPSAGLYRLIQSENISMVLLRYPNPEKTKLDVFAFKDDEFCRVKQLAVHQWIVEDVCVGWARLVAACQESSACVFGACQTSH